MSSSSSDHCPLVTVILASYNHELYVAEAVRSVLFQSLGDFELIVVDDGSSDATPDIVEAFRDSRLTLVRNPNNREIHPRNLALGMARGRYIAFQNSDDVWEPTKLSRQVEIMEADQNIAACFTAVEIIDEAGAKNDHTWAQNLFTIENRPAAAWLRHFFDFGNCLAIPSAVVRRCDLVNLGGFRGSLVQLSDFDLWIRCAAHGKLEIFPEPLTQMRIVQGLNLSRPSPGGARRSSIEHSIVLERYLEPQLLRQFSEIFPDLPDPGIDAARKIVIAQRAATRHGGAGLLFADRAIMSVIDDPGERANAASALGPEYIHLFLKQRTETEFVLRPAERSVEVPLSSSASVVQWIEDVKKSCATSVVPGSIFKSKAWHFDGRKIEHSSGRFFKVVGLRWNDGEEPRSGIFLEQREIGTLGFICRLCGDGLEILVNAKAEPGNVGFVQLAPTCQATASNSDRIHGGNLPPYASYFASIKGVIVSDTLQSEHGDRFLGKLNRNVLVIDNDVEVMGTEHRWISMKVFLKLIGADFLVNTDARSVLVCADWNLLANGQPFSAPDMFSQELLASHRAEPRLSVLGAIEARISDLRAQSENAEGVDLARLAGARLLCDDEATIVLSDRYLSHIYVQSPTREVAEWDQPILGGHQEQRIELFCGRNAAGLVFGFRALWEPGLVRHVELGPTRISSREGVQEAGQTRLSVRQSDEGSRFLHDIAEYQIVDIGAARDDKDLIWLTLAEVHILKSTIFFNNEARNAISLLLTVL